MAKKKTINPAKVMALINGLRYRIPDADWYIEEWVYQRIESPYGTGTWVTSIDGKEDIGTTLSRCGGLWLKINATDHPDGMNHFENELRNAAKIFRFRVERHTIEYVTIRDYPLCIHNEYGKEYIYKIA